MLIFEIIPSLYPANGAEQLVLQLSKQFIKKGHKVVIISLYYFENSYIQDFCRTNNIELISLNKKI